MSFQDVLQNDNIKLDLNFKNSMIADLISVRCAHVHALACMHPT